MAVGRHGDSRHEDEARQEQWKTHTHTQPVTFDDCFQTHLFHAQQSPTGI